jgi:hypothetical protein
MMMLPDDIRDEFAVQVRRVLASHPRHLAAFESCWGANEFRKAYLIAKEAIEELQLDRDAPFEDANRKFYWSYVA